jgi:hypothetical protein
MRIVPAIEMHNDFEQEDIVHRERLSDGLSLHLALPSKIMVHFDSLSGGISTSRKSTGKEDRINLFVEGVELAKISLGCCAAGTRKHSCSIKTEQGGSRDLLSWKVRFDCRL